MIEKVRLFVLYFPAFLFALAFHESAHAWVASRLGDPTAKNLGRISFNPLSHIDVFGTLVLPVFSWFYPGLLPIAGWGKPVPVDYRNLKNPRRQGMWISLAGPFSNFLLAVGFALFLRGLLLLLAGLDDSRWLSYPTRQGVFDFVLHISEISVWINLGLGLFNLLPLHPLDGGKIAVGLLPLSWALWYDRFARYGALWVALLFYMGAFRYLIERPLKMLVQLLIPA